MKQLMIMAMLLLGTAIAGAQEGYQFPAMSGQNVNGKTIDLPGDVGGKYTVIGVAYSQDAELYLRSWYEPMYVRFIDKSGIFDLVYDVNLKLVLMFTGVKKGAANKAMANMKKMADEELFNYVMFYQGELKTYKESLGLVDKSRPYIFVLDKSGKIIHVTSGKYTEKKMEELAELVEE